ncbi:helix-turn-helix transcriptional regulator [Glaesserella parasuis]|uniref:helix-turn-helix domain-containing protein n=1 Tax=Glaesserella parasuis TaxID=738 RepID=UPI00243723A9|nr:helix-turn-helix transcriptional regulator [Glaesserella parasuis]MDG6474667.1 helix-turn-helix transcriptional regulator [Glaesserella parasuis]MDO9813856.1 helix-turn-helix transcriptional regulator [Glaesserella parasuis]MDP0347714.1 helix-turn-helix transcriptional regulator [Glaesserella parasuis]
MNLQFINDQNNNPLFVVLPITEYNRLKKCEAQLTDNEEEWESLPYEQSDNDDVLIPHEVVTAMIKHNLNHLGAWRIYRNLSQQEVAELTGLSQSAISQMERSDSRPQKKTLERFSKIYDCDVKQMY